MTEHDDWRYLAQCSIQRTDPELFFPKSETTRQGTAQVEEAIAVCKTGCEVIAICYRQAYDGGLEGIWGGSTESERNSRRRKAQRVLAKRND